MGVNVGVNVCVAVGVGVMLGVSVAVAVGVRLGVMVGVVEGVLLGVVVGVSDGVVEGVVVGVSDGVLLGVMLGVSVSVGVGVSLASPTSALKPRGLNAANASTPPISSTASAITHVSGLLNAERRGASSVVRWGPCVVGFGAPVPAATGIPLLVGPSRLAGVVRGLIGSGVVVKLVFWLGRSRMADLNASANSRAVA